MNKIKLFLILIVVNIITNYALSTSNNSLFKNDLPESSTERKRTNIINCSKTITRTLTESNEIPTKKTNDLYVSKTKVFSPFSILDYQTQVIDAINERISQKKELENDPLFKIILSVSSTQMKYETELDIDTLKVSLINRYGNIFYRVTLTKGETLYFDKPLPNLYTLAKFEYGSKRVCCKLLIIMEELKHISISEDFLFQHENEY